MDAPTLDPPGTIAVIGAVPGLLIGAWMGDAMTNLYGDYFRLPNLAYRFDLAVAGVAIAISMAAAAGGAPRGGHPA